MFIPLRLSLYPAIAFALSATPSCRFASSYTSSQILSNPGPILNDLLYWEGKFHQDNVGYNAANGMTYDGTLLDPLSGIRTDKHPFSAASKESLQMMLYARAISGSSEAARFLSPNNPSKAPDVAFGILETKLASYRQFNSTFPGFGGFLPWFLHNGSDPLQPTSDWVIRVPALDNGENLWAIYGLVQVLHSHPSPAYKALGDQWRDYLDYTKTTAKKIFYAGQGKVCAVTDLANQSLPVDDPKQSYKCEGDGTLNDPYEGELFTWWLDFYGGVSDEDREALWAVKRPQLVRVNYQNPGHPNITVQKGFWFSSHENWKFMEMPYLSVPLLKRIYTNNERARTCNSFWQSLPGMYASINNSTDSNGQIIGYISNAGIPQIANQTIQELDVVTPYSVFPLTLINRTMGLVWWHHLVQARKMQNPYGSSESTRLDGTATSSFVSWDSKVTTVNAILGGVADFVQAGLKKEGLYNRFVERINGEYERVFGPQAGGLEGEHVEICGPPATTVPKILKDFTACR